MSLFEVNCRDCWFYEETKTRGAARELAMEHTDSEGHACELNEKPSVEAVQLEDVIDTVEDMSWTDPDPGEFKEKLRMLESFRVSEAKVSDPNRFMDGGEAIT